ncbi:MAG TPA: hypothetical protein VF170_14985 [Planctomycetaceae bacterium]
MRRLAELLERADELTERAAERAEELRAEASPVAAWVHDVRGDSCRLEAARLRAQFAGEAAELWPLLLSYAEAWSAGGRRAA